MATKKVTSNPKETKPAVKKVSQKPETVIKPVRINPDEFAIVGLDAHQYQVKTGDSITIEKINLKKGEKFICEQVLLYTDGKATNIGTPYLADTKVIFEYQEDTRGEKLRVAHFRHKSRYRKVKGHRQDLSLLKVLEINCQ